MRWTFADSSFSYPLAASEAEDSADTAGPSAPKAAPPQQSDSLRAAIAAQDAPEGAELKALDFDIGKSLCFSSL